MVEKTQVVSGSAPRLEKGPRGHRALIWVCSTILCLLLIWLVGFFLNDIDRLPGPDYNRLLEENLDAEQVSGLADLREAIQEVEREIRDQEQRQAVLRDSTSATRETMNQLLEIQRLSLQQGLTLSDEEQRSLAESKQLFLSNQSRYQELNEAISVLQEQRRELQEEQFVLNRGLEEEKEQVRRLYEQLREKHDFKLALIKILVLLPLIGVTVWCFIRYRHGLYASAVYALVVAMIWHFGVVLHDHFPRKYFKYILILAALAMVGRVLLMLLRFSVKPKSSWLLKRFREAYEIFRCPICAYPIRRGPLRYGFWTGRSLRKWTPPSEAHPLEDKPYHCPSCGATLFEKCESCGSVRHSMLPTCEHCGAEKELFPT